MNLKAKSIIPTRKVGIFHERDTMAKNVMIGGYTAQEARNLLLIRGVEHVKGIVPHNAPKIEDLAEFDDLPEWWLSGVWEEPVDYERWLWNNEGYGEIRGIAIRIDIRMCYECFFSIRQVFKELSPTIFVVCDVRQGYCELCGKWENDDIPF